MKWLQRHRLLVRHLCLNFLNLLSSEIKLSSLSSLTISIQLSFGYLAEAKVLNCWFLTTGKSLSSLLTREEFSETRWFSKSILPPPDSTRQSSAAAKGILIQSTPRSLLKKVIK